MKPALHEASILPPGMADFLSREFPSGEMIAGVLSNTALNILGAATGDVTIDAQFVVKQRRKRGKLPILTYALIADLIANPTVILDQGDRRVLLMLRAGDLWSGAVKTTQDKQKNYLLNFRRSNADDAKRLLARDKLVFGDAADLLDD
jgi:hypothetical protein